MDPMESIQSVVDPDRLSEIFEDVAEIPNDRDYQPNTIKSKHKSILALRATGQYSNNDLAELFDMTPSRVSTIANSPAAKAAEARMAAEFVGGLTADVQTFLKGASLQAARTVHALMQSADSEQVQMRCAFDILDRGGHKPVEKKVTANVDMSPEAAALLAEGMRDIAEYNSTEVPFEVVENSAEAFGLDSSGAPVTE